MQAPNISFNPNLPTVTSLSGYRLKLKGWIRENGVYKKDGMTLRYTGDKWILNESETVEFFEDIKPKQ